MRAATKSGLCSPFYLLYTRVSIQLNGYSSKACVVDFWIADDFCSQFLADFVVNLFVTTANSTSIVRDDAFQCNQYELYAQSALEARKSSGRPLLGQYTPDLYIIYDPARPEETKIIIDAVDTKNADQAFSEKENTYSALCDVLYVVVGNGDGSFEVRRSKSVDRAVADRTARFFESVFGLCLVNKLTQHKVDQRAQFHQEYAVLRRELQYWSHCKVLKRIVRTRR